jgi:hypothetical protein
MRLSLLLLAFLPVFGQQFCETVHLNKGTIICSFEEDGPPPPTQLIRHGAGYVDSMVVTSGYHRVNVTVELDECLLVTVRNDKTGILKRISDDEYDPILRCSVVNSRRTVYLRAEALMPVLRSGTGIVDVKTRR